MNSKALKTVRKVSMLTSKGQVTIPKGFRDALGLGEGDGVVFELRDGEAVMRKHERKSILELGGVARGRARRRAAG